MGEEAALVLSRNCEKLYQQFLPQMFNSSWTICNMHCAILSLHVEVIEGMSKTFQELRMLSSVTINCQTTKIVMNSGSQLSEL